MPWALNENFVLTVAEGSLRAHHVYLLLPFILISCWTQDLQGHLRERCSRLMTMGRRGGHRQGRDEKLDLYHFQDGVAGAGCCEFTGTMREQRHGRLGGLAQGLTLC
uniref:Uncharacterized protein n=1 Tax=Macaca fascicularis TaxID=9541 RepID=Q95K44_MACFA|nr:hypothetical protein [Macaca fascicularis]